jgi:hypothetical protein
MEAPQRIFSMSFASVDTHYVAKVERKERTRAELDTVLRWFTGFDDVELASHLDAGTTFAALFDAARLPAAADAIRGVVCGVRVETVEDPLMRKIRQMDKLVDELAKGKAVEKAIRG